MKNFIKILNLLKTVLIKFVITYMRWFCYLHNKKGYFDANPDVDEYQ